MRAREADSTIAAQLLDQARQLVGAGVSPAIDADPERSELRLGADPARGGPERGRPARLDLLRALDLPSGTRIELADSLGPGGARPAARRPTRPRPSPGSIGPSWRRSAPAPRPPARSLGAIRAEYLPSLGLTGQYQETGQRTERAGGSYTVQLQLTVPILDGFRRQNRVKEQRLRVDIQEIRERDLVNQVETEARQAVLDVASAQQQVAIARDRLRLAEQELAQAQQRFQAGVAGSVETTNAQSSVIAARDAVIQAQVNFGTARVSAYRALGIIDQLH